MRKIIGIAIIALLAGGLGSQVHEHGRQYELMTWRY
jgi:hypothetical protein